MSDRWYSYIRLPNSPSRGGILGVYFVEVRHRFELMTQICLKMAVLKSAESGENEEDKPPFAKELDPEDS